MKELKYAIMAATVLGFSACTNEDDVTGGNYAADPDAVVVSASIGAPLTRANTEGDGDQFSEKDIIYVENTGNGKITGKEKGYYRLETDGTWTPCDVNGNVNSTQYIVWGNDGSNDFQGVYPATAAESFTLPINQNSLELLRSADYMIGAPKAGTDATTKPADKKLSLTFTHQLAKVTVMLVFNDQYTGNETINSLSFYLTDGTTSISAYGHEITEGSETKKVYTAILNPGSYTAGNDFCTINVNGTELAVKVPTGGITLTEGKAHKLTLYVGKNKIKFGNITVNDWGTIQPLNDNVADENIEAEVDETTHTITTKYAGQIAAAPGVIAKAVGTGGALNITGPMNSNDFAALKEYLTNDANTELALNLTAVTELTEIPDKALSGCANLASVQLSDEITRIGASAFNGCTNLTTVNMPQNLISMGTNAFLHSGLSGEIELPEGFTTLDPMSDYNPSMQFDYTNITALTLPESLGDITVNTIRCCFCNELTTVTFKSTVKELFNMAFNKSPKLTDVYMLGNATEAPVISDYLFDDKTKVTIHVPKGASSYFSDLVSAGYTVVEITE